MKLCFPSKTSVVTGVVLTGFKLQFIICIYNCIIVIELIKYFNSLLDAIPSWDQVRVCPSIHSRQGNHWLHVTCQN